jgi:excisionase family DNA binding protein
MRPELQSALTVAQQLDCSELPRLLGELEEIKCTALARLTSPTPALPADELLTIEQAAERLSLSKQYLYQHPELPFVRHMGRSLRFSANGISEYISTRKQRKRST